MTYEAFTLHGIRWCGDPREPLDLRIDVVEDAAELLEELGERGILRAEDTLLSSGAGVSSADEDTFREVFFYELCDAAREAYAEERRWREESEMDRKVDERLGK